MKYKRPRKNRYQESVILVTLLIIILFFVSFELKLLQTQLLVHNIIKEGINFDAFREMKIDEEALEKAEIRVKHLTRENPKLSQYSYYDKVGYLTFSMLARDYNLVDYGPVDEVTFHRGIGKVAATSAFKELYGYYDAVISDLEYFPVPKMEAAEVSYEDSWYDLRNYGGKRRHEGTDLMASNNLRGFFPVLSISDGTIEKMGWLEQGGYRIGVRSEQGGYFYYAHLYTYAQGLKQGDTVIAGQLLGFMGDSGYGKEGTIGKFDVHLHVGIYVNSNIGEMSVDPYWILKILENNRITYDDR